MRAQVRACYGRPHLQKAVARHDDPKAVAWWQEVGCLRLEAAGAGGFTEPVGPHHWQLRLDRARVLVREHCVRHEVRAVAIEHGLVGES